MNVLFGFFDTGTMSCVAVSIKNFGKTIPADELQHIFDKFYRSKEYGQSEENGTGLGLPLAEKRK